jgi:hypothetical protein
MNSIIYFLELIIAKMLTTAYNEKHTDPNPTKTLAGTKKFKSFTALSNKKKDRNKHVKNMNKGMNGTVKAWEKLDLQDLEVNNSLLKRLKHTKEMPIIMNPGEI